MVAGVSVWWEDGWLSGRLRWLRPPWIVYFFPHPCPSRVLRRQQEPGSPSAVGRGAGADRLRVTACVASARQGGAAGGCGPGEAEGPAGQR